MRGLPLNQDSGQGDLQEGAALRVASFNVQVFGKTKMKNAMVRDVLVKVQFGSKSLTKSGSSQKILKLVLFQQCSIVTFI